MRDTVAKNFDETYLMLKKYDRLVKEYDRVTTGASIETRTKIWVVTHIIDKGTKLKMSVRPELRHGPKLTYESIIAFVEELYIDGLAESRFGNDQTTCT